MRRELRTVALALVGLLLLLAPLGTPPALAQDGGAGKVDEKHSDYYYPEPELVESYGPRAETLPEANRGLRVGFVTGMTNAQLSKPVRPGVAIFAKGDEAQKLIVVALEEGYIDSLYRARAFFAMMTAIARTLPIFEQHGVEEWFTFFDLAKMLGFELITFTDGKDFAYQVVLE
ncbi:MAG: hypothetical protein WDZ84_10670 [Rhodovibrionaceae bacterium]